MTPTPPVWPDLLARALRLAAESHDGQRRKGSGRPLPYLEHVVAVGWMLDRLGFPPAVVAAGLLHDLVEDTSVTVDDLSSQFGTDVSSLVTACTEQKLDSHGAKRPWALRKRESLDSLAVAPPDARAVALADKLHNLLSLEAEIAVGHDPWPAFNALREDVLAYYREAASRWGLGDPRLAPLATACLSILDRLDPPTD